MTPAHFTEVLFTGFFTAAGLYSALIYLINRDRPFLLYAALMDACAAAQFVFAGDLLGLQAGTERLLIFRTVCYAAFFLAQAGFARSFLRLAAAPTRTTLVMNVVLGLNLAALAVAMRWGPAGPYQLLDHVLFVLLLAVCGAAGLPLAREGDESARFYVAGFAGAVLAMIGSAAADALHLRGWPEYLFQLGIAWEGALLALALAAGYTKLDPLTGAKSRGAFDQRLAGAWRSAKRRGEGLALILIAADGVRAYESKAGRVATDAVLRRIAHLCASCCRDRVDLFGRYGDEAFAAIIPGATRAQADEIAERMRAVVSADCRLPIGVGVSSIENASSAEALVQQAARRGARDAIMRAGSVPI